MVGINPESVQYSELHEPDSDWSHDLAHCVLSIATLNPAVDRNCARIDLNVLGAAMSGLRRWLGSNLGRHRLAINEHHILANGAVLFALPGVGGSVADDRIVLRRCDTPLRSAILGRAWRYMERPCAGRTDRPLTQRQQLSFRAVSVR